MTLQNLFLFSYGRRPLFIFKMCRSSAFNVKSKTCVVCKITKLLQRNVREGKIKDGSFSILKNHISVSDSLGTKS